MNEPICNDDNCIIDETECCGGTRDTNWPDPDRNPDGNPSDEPDGGKKPRPIEETECCGGGTTGNWPHKEPDEGKKPTGHKKPTPGGPIVMVGDEELNWPTDHKDPKPFKKPRPIEETECCGGTRDTNWPDGLIPKPGGPGPENKPTGHKKPTPGGPVVMVNDGNWPDEDTYPELDEEGWKKPSQGVKPLTGGGPHIPIEDPSDEKDPHEGMGPYRVMGTPIFDRKDPTDDFIGPILDRKEPGDGSAIAGPRPI